ncbi:MAG: rhodanese-related sulfurtransferase [Acholeplasmataceae bacterium]|nr:rhodanese-related sulfurtransferase [Acholeplasmataceae bacterium]
MNDYRVLLYYHYNLIEDPDTVRIEHLKFCKEIGLLGRVFISREGINGTVSGTVEQTNLYMKMLEENKHFKGIQFKIDEVSEHVFKKMHVRVKNELVNFSLEDDINPKEITGKYLEPIDFYQGLLDPNTIVIDARNDYEYDIGHFRGAIKPEIQTFRELPNWIREHKELFKGKKIMTYCTGGVRCEKFSGWLKREGFEDVGQLHGGIVTYGKDPIAQGEFWDGNCYVFDKRLSVPINRVEHVIVGRDYFTGEPCERYINCANPECNKQIIASEENERINLGACSDTCRSHPRNRYVLKMKENEAFEK